MSKWASFFDPADQSSVHCVPVDPKNPNRLKARPEEIANGHILSEHCWCKPQVERYNNGNFFANHKDPTRSLH